MLGIVVPVHGCYRELSKQAGKLRSEVFIKRACSTQIKQAAETPGMRKVKLKVLPFYGQSCCM